ncbi:MAG: glycosyl transferase family 90 [Parachlamydiaceae bacterium]
MQSSLSLWSNSVVLKQTSDNIQWYYLGIKPYEHYIPVANNFSDLIDKIKWAKEHDNEARQIALNGTQFVLNNLRKENTQLYLFLLLTKYAELQKFQPREAEKKLATAGI